MTEIDPSLLARESQKIALTLHQMSQSGDPGKIGIQRGNGVSRFIRIMELPELDNYQLDQIKLNVDGIGQLCERFIGAIAVAASEQEWEDMISHASDLEKFLINQFSKDVKIQPLRF